MRERELMIKKLESGLKCAPLISMWVARGANILLHSVWQFKWKFTVFI